MKIIYANHYEQCKEIGPRIKVYWTREEIGTSNLNVGWYTGNVICMMKLWTLIDIRFVVNEK